MCFTERGKLCGVCMFLRSNADSDVMQLLRDVNMKGGYKMRGIDDVS